jgi:hypothetical protein
MSTSAVKTPSTAESERSPAGKAIAEMVRAIAIAARDASTTPEGRRSALGRAVSQSAKTARASGVPRLEATPSRSSSTESRVRMSPACGADQTPKWLKTQNRVPERRIDTGKVRTHAIRRLRTVAHCRPV